MPDRPGILFRAVWRARYAWYLYRHSPLSLIEALRYRVWSGVWTLGDADGQRRPESPIEAAQAEIDDMQERGR